MGSGDVAKFATEQAGDSFGFTAYALFGGTEKRIGHRGGWATLAEAIESGVIEVRVYLDSVIENGTPGPAAHAKDFDRELKELI